MTDLTAIDGNKGGPVATTVQAAGIEFKSVKQLKLMSKNDREQAIKNLANSVYQAAMISMNVVTQDKDELIARAAANHEAIPLLVDTVFSGTDAAQTLLELVRCGEARWHIALAAVLADKPA